MSDAERLAALAQAPDLYAALDAAMADLVGHKLFTLMVLDRDAEEAARVYSSSPQAYPVSGRKPLGTLSRWGAVVLERGEPFLGRTAEDIRWAFADHELILSLGCESVLNLPVKDRDGAVIGTMNLLHRAHGYTREHAARLAPFAALLAPAYRAGIRRATGGEDAGLGSDGTSPRGLA